MPNAESLIGATLGGKFRIKRVLGAGSMGFVCEAEHVELGKRVAIKLIDSALAGDANISNRFRREARAASLVESEHIVQVFDVGRDDRFGLYIVMENLIGEDLAARLERESVLDIETSVRIAHQCARALSKAHAAGVVHRDLKPGNIFLVDREDGATFVKILDFGISKLQGVSLDRSLQMQLTRTGTAVGTPQYMSPEQAQGLPTVDHRTDIWSLGIVLYEMLSGALPFPELPTYEQFIIHMVTKPPRPLAEFAPWVPQAVCAVVHDAIVHDPAARIQDAATLASRLAGAVPNISSGPFAKASGRHHVVSPAAFPVTEGDEEEAPSNETIVMSSPPQLTSGGSRTSDRVPSTRREPSRNFESPSSQRIRRSPVPRPSYESIENEEISDDDAPMFFQRESGQDGKQLPFPSVKLRLPTVPAIKLDGDEIRAARSSTKHPTSKRPTSSQLGGPESVKTARLFRRDAMRYLPVAVGVAVVLLLGFAWQMLR